MSVGERFCLLGAQLTKNCFGRNSAPPGIVGDYFSSSEPRPRCATCVQPRLPMVRPPAAAIRDLRLLGVWGTWRNFAAPSGARNGPRTPKGRFSWSWGPFWRKHPPTKFDRMLNADPLNPVWGPTCPWGPGYDRFLGGHFVGWRLVLSVRDSTDKKELAVNWRHQQVFGGFWLIGTVFPLRNFLTLTTLGGFTRVFRESRN